MLTRWDHLHSCPLSSWSDSRDFAWLSYSPLRSIANILSHSGVSRKNHHSNSRILCLTKPGNKLFLFIRPFKICPTKLLFLLYVIQFYSSLYVLHTHTGTHGCVWPFFSPWIYCQFLSVDSRFTWEACPVAPGPIPLLPNILKWVFFSLEYRNPF